MVSPTRFQLHYSYLFLPIYHRSVRHITSVRIFVFRILYIKILASIWTTITQTTMC